MKLVQFLRPLFFVALGLHGLLLFLPVGESDPAVIEDIALDERPESDTALLPPPLVPGGLPVPNPDVSIEQTSRSTSATARARTTAKPTQTRGAASTRSAPSRTASTRTAPRARPPVNLGSRTRPNSTDTERNETNRSANADIASAAQTNDSVMQAAASESGRSTSPAQQTDADVDAENESVSNGDTSGRLSLASLTSGVIRDFPNAVESLEALVVAFDQSLAYGKAATTDESAERSRSQWKATLEQQANISSPTAVTITEVPNAFEISYPIQMSENLLIEDERKEYLSGRKFSICLEKEPSQAEVGVFFDAQGNLVDEPVIIRSTGYMLLDEEIRAVAADPDNIRSSQLSESFSESSIAIAQNRRSNAYILEVKVSYDESSCVSLSDLRKLNLSDLRE